MNKDPQLFSDKELVKFVLENDTKVILYFFYRKFLPTFQYHVYKIFPYQVEIQDLIHEFFLYLHEDDWRRLRTFNFSSSLSTWISTVSFRFFLQYKKSVIDSNGLISLNECWDSFAETYIQHADNEIKMDIMKAIEQIKNERDRSIAFMLLIEGSDFEDVAKKYSISVDYVYTIKNRIIKSLRNTLKDYSL